MDTLLLRPAWQRIFRHAWILNLFLFILLACLRAYGALGPANARIFIMLNFLLMWFLPLIFLSSAGRSAIGLKKVDRPIWLVWGALLGGFSAFVIFAAGYGLYGFSAENWYISVRESLAIEPVMLGMPWGILFMIYTVPAMIFSPIGEEFFFRGMIHESVNIRWGLKAATLVNALAFGSVHILHHGLRWSETGLRFSPISGVLWILFMMGVSGLFTLCRQRGGSIWGSVVAHSAFNFVMNLTIFRALL